MKIFHTADWHLGKLVQGVYMTEDQAYILDQFIQAIIEEQPDVIIIAGDLYDRAVPPTEAVHLLNEVLNKIVLELKIPVIAIAGNHDSPSRLQFASGILKQKGLHLVGQLLSETEPVVLQDEYGEVHFHLVPYADPSLVRNYYQDEAIKTHDDAAKKIVESIKEKKDPSARHVYVGHAFITPTGEEAENTSDSERPLSIGGAEHVSARYFLEFDYVAFGHLHQAHHVLAEHIRYAGSLMKYSISEANHKKGFYIIEMDGEGACQIEKRLLTPKRDMRRVEAMMEDLLTHPINEDYVFVTLLDQTPMLSPMEKIRSVYPNVMHVERKNTFVKLQDGEKESIHRSKLTDFELFEAFYKEVKGVEATEETTEVFKDILEEILKDENND